MHVSTTFKLCLHSGFSHLNALCASLKSVKCFEYISECLPIGVRLLRFTNGKTLADINLFEVGPYTTFLNPENAPQKCPTIITFHCPCSMSFHYRLFYCLFHNRYSAFTPNLKANTIYYKKVELFIVIQPN